MPEPLFAGRYQLERELGRGSFGVVHLAVDTRLRNRRVALKILHPQLSVDPETLALFEGEAGMLAGLRHDHIITVYDAGVWKDQRYLLMEYIEGPSLAQVVADKGAQPADGVASWLRQAAAALAYAHEQGVVHRDMKAANLLLETARNRIFLTDFGLARAVEVSGGSASTNVHTLTGTAAYRAPEVRTTGHTPASDLYGLGVVAYELLAGRRPFLDKDPLDLMLAHATEPAPSLPTAVPTWLQSVVMALLAKDPAQRPTAAKVQAAARPPAPPATPAPAREPASVAPTVTATQPTPVPDAPAPPFMLRSGVQVRSLSEFVRQTEKNPVDLFWHLGQDGLILWLESLGRADLAKLCGQLRDTPPGEGPKSLKRFLDATGVKHAYSATPLVEFDWVTVPAGPFLMGSDPRNDPQARDDEKPQHRVELPAFRIARVPVTNAQYQAFVDATGQAPPSHWTGGKAPAGRADHPVVQVSWVDALAFCRWANVRLPTEAEWEKAARGVDGRTYPWGYAAPDAKRCNCKETGQGGTTPVGKHPEGASPYGVLDMAGNVWEWTSSLYEKYPYKAVDGREDPKRAGNRVLRGGSYYHDAVWVRCAVRHNDQLNRLDYRGFRVASPGF